MGHYRIIKPHSKGAVCILVCVEYRKQKSQAFVHVVERKSEAKIFIHNLGQIFTRASSNVERMYTKANREYIKKENASSIFTHSPNRSQTGPDCIRKFFDSSGLFDTHTNTCTQRHYFFLRFRFFFLTTLLLPGCCCCCWLLAKLLDCLITVKLFWSNTLPYLRDSSVIKFRLSVCKHFR